MTVLLRQRGSAEKIKEFAAELRNVLSDKCLVEKKAFVRSFVKEVTVTGDEMRLSYTIPLMAEGLEKERAELVGVLPILQYGGR
jgi:site-specific DNA recombinase